MTLTKMQQKIYDTFYEDGYVWADCPRQSGKTTALIQIASDFVECNKLVAIKTITEDQFYYFKNKIIDEFKRNPNREMILDFTKIIRFTESPKLGYKLDLLIGDEVNLSEFSNAKHIACCWTTQKKILRFSFSDMDEPFQDKIIEFSKYMPKEVFERDYNVGWIK